MPGIVQHIDKANDKVELFYPHYKDKYPDYTGGSCCSIYHCGVHKIDVTLAEAFLKVGEERANRVYDFLQRNVHIKSCERSIQFYEHFKKIWENKSIEELTLLYNKYQSDYMYRQMFDDQNINNINDFRQFEINKFINLIDEAEDKLADAWEKFDSLYHQTIIDLANNVINNTTKGIWLSYQKHTLKRNKDGTRVIILNDTDEKFIVKKTRKKYHFIKKL